MANPFDQFDAQQPAANPFDQFEAPMLQEVVVSPDATEVMEQPSAIESVFQGAIVDPVSAGAQMLTRALPDSVVNAVNELNNYIASTTGLVAPIPQGGVDEMIKQQQQQYSARQGDEFDVGRLVGAVVSPLNYVAGGGALSAMNRLQQGGRVAQGLAKAVPAVAGGAAAALSAPITEGDYVEGLTQQTALGAAGGQAGAVIGNKIATMLANRQAQRGAANMSLDQIKQMIQSEAIKEFGSLPVGFDADGIAAQVQNALKQGQRLDPRAAVRQEAGRRVLGDSAGLMSGQISRDPQEWAREFNLAQIEGVGKPIADRLNAQEKQLISALTSTGSLVDPYDAGTVAGRSLKKLDETLSSQVSEKYTKFRTNGGARVDVNLGPVQQAYGNAIEEFGVENLPSAVRNRLESYVSADAGQRKVFDLLEADRLLKIINANYDPAKSVQNKALGSIKEALSQSIDELSDSSRGADKLLREAISTAKKRFDLHKELPALRDYAFNDLQAQEKFVQKYVTGASASIDQVGKLVKSLDQEALGAVRGAVLRDIVMKAAPGAEAGIDTAKISPAALRKALNGIGDRKLEALFGKDGAARLKEVQYVAELVKNAPAGATPNRSGTAAGIANFVQSKLFNLPIVNIPANLISGSVTDFQQGKAISGALSGQVPASPVSATIERLQGLQGLGSAIGIPTGAAAVQGLDD